MHDKPISDLRRRLIADMTVRTFGDKTRHDYIRHIEAFAKFLGRSPDTATGDDIRRQRGTRPCWASPDPQPRHGGRLAVPTRPVGGTRQCGAPA